MNRAKADSNPCLDMLARLAVIKFLRFELKAQFAQVLERCRMTLKSYEGCGSRRPGVPRARGGFQVAKKIILRKTGQELFRTLREIEKETWRVPDGRSSATAPRSSTSSSSIR